MSLTYDHNDNNNERKKLSLEPCWLLCIIIIVITIDLNSLRGKIVVDCITVDCCSWLLVNCLIVFSYYIKCEYVDSIVNCCICMCMCVCVWMLKGLGLLLLYHLTCNNQLNIIIIITINIILNNSTITIHLIYNHLTNSIIFIFIINENNSWWSSCLSRIKNLWKFILRITFRKTIKSWKKTNRFINNRKEKVSLQNEYIITIHIFWF